jgi:hypothetical protein
VLNGFQIFKFYHCRIFYFQVLGHPLKICRVLHFSALYGQYLITNQWLNLAHVITLFTVYDGKKVCSMQLNCSSEVRDI